MSAPIVSFPGEREVIRKTTSGCGRSLWKDQTTCEVTYPGCLTIRTSIIGRGLRPGPGLLDWFLAQRGKAARGYARAIFSGLTTRALSDAIADLLERQAELEGFFTCLPRPSANMTCLQLVNHEMSLGITLERDESFVCDRSLDSSKFRNATGYSSPSWANMIAAIAAETE